jgi:hypothetical protein
LVAAAISAGAAISVDVEAGATGAR